MRQHLRGQRGEERRRRLEKEKAGLELVSLPLSGEPGGCMIQRSAYTYTD